MKRTDKVKVYYKKTDEYSSHMVIAKIIARQNQYNTKILDLGCDIGFLGQTLSRFSKKYEIHGVDIDKTNLKKAEKYYYKTYNFDLNLEKWPINDKYEIVVLADTMEHLNNPQLAINNSVKILKKRGTLIISVPNIVFWWSRAQILIGRFPKDNRGIFDKTHRHFFTRKTLYDLISLNKTLKVEYFLSTTFPLQFVLRKSSSSRVFKLIYSFNYILSKLWPDLFSYQLIYVVSKI